MSVSRDRITFFAVLVAVGVAVWGYVQIGGVYPTTGRDDSTRQPDAERHNAADGGEEGAAEEADHLDHRPGDPRR